MNCNCCGKVVTDIMIFCPYCGNKIGGDKNETIKDTDMREEILILYKDAKYQEILSYALEGDIIAKNYYIRYVMYRADQSQLSNDEELINTLKQNMESGSMFAKAALGIYKFYHGKRGVLGITDDSAIAMGRQLIRESAESDEPAAMTILAEWLLKGDGVDKDEFVAYKMMKSVAEKGYPPAIYRLGLWHCQGTGGISRNEELGNDLIEKAAFWGDSDAREHISKEDSQWLESKLNYFISEDDMENVISLVSTNVGIKEDNNLPFQSEYEDCQSKNDYITLYKHLRDEYSNDESAEDMFDFLELFVSNITGYSLGEVTFEEAEASMHTAQRIAELTDMYELPQHYLHFKDDLKTLEIDIADEDMPGLMNIVSKGLREKCQKEIEEYVSYCKAEKDAKWEGLGCVLVLSALVAIIGAIILPIVGIVAGGFILLCIIAKISNKATFKKISKTHKENYLLINELIGYGYTLWEYGMYKYNPKEVLCNKTPSVLTKKQQVLADKCTDENDNLLVTNHNAKNICPSCKKGNTYDAKFCIYCGLKLTALKCNRCGAKISENQKYCSSCGIKL